MFLKIKSFNPNTFAKNIMGSHKGKNNSEKNQHIKKSIINIEIMYNELINNYIL